MTYNLLKVINVNNNTTVVILIRRLQNNMQ